MESSLGKRDKEENLINISFSEPLTKKQKINNNNVLDLIQNISKSKYSSLLATNNKIFSLSKNKTLYTFNDNNNNNNNYNTIIPIQINGLINITMISCGFQHIICLNDNGNVYSFGSNNYGQLGVNKNITSVYLPQQLFLPPIKQVSCGDDFTICLSHTGKLYSFGDNSFGQLGLNNTISSDSPKEILLLSNIEFVECGGFHVICKLYDNTFYSWGSNKYGQLGHAKLNTIKPRKCIFWPNCVIDIKCGLFHSLLLTSNCRVYSFGRNSNGELGLNSKHIKQLIIPALIHDDFLIQRIECGSYHSMCIDLDYNLWVFGQNIHGELGLEDKESRYKPIKHPTLSNIIDISSKGTCTFVKNINNHIYTFGYHSFLESPIPKYQLTPIQVLQGKEDIWISNLTKKSYDIDYIATSCDDIDDSINPKKIKNSNRNKDIDINNNKDSNDIDNMDIDNISDENDKKQETEESETESGFDKDFIVEENEEEIEEEIEEESGEEEFEEESEEESEESEEKVVKKKIEKRKEKIKDNKKKENKKKEDIQVLENKFNYNTPPIICSYNRTIFLFDDKTVYSSGICDMYSHGHKNINIFPPKQIQGLENIKSIACGNKHTVCVDYSGNCYAFGNNTNGQLGKAFKPETVPKYIDTPIKLDFPPIEQVSCGNTFTMCLTKDGNLYAFGSNKQGQFGIGNYTTYDIPKLIKNIKQVEYVVCGGFHTICKTKNKLYGWGDNTYGQIGHYKCNKIRSAKPLKKFNENIIDIKCGLYHTLILKTNGKVYPFGRNNYGQLGTTIENPSFYKTIENIPTIKKIGCGYHHSMCIDINNNIWFFGHNSFGQLGLGDKDDRDKPILHPTLNNIINISSGGNHTFVKTEDDKIYAFGSNNSLQLGIETKDKDQLTPIQVFIENKKQDLSNLFIESRVPNTQIEYILKPNYSTIICSNTMTLCISNDRCIYSFGKTREEDIAYPMKQIQGLKNIKMISSGYQHAIFIDYIGDIYSFGNNNYGQLGVNKDTIKYTIIPQKIELPPIKQISSGYNFTACVTEDNRLFVFGNNDYGQLGVGNTTCNPNKINILDNIDFVECGGMFIICKTYNNEFLFWGDNRNGQLGSKYPSKLEQPTKSVNWPNNIIDIKCGFSHSLILTSLGQIYSSITCFESQIGVNCKQYPELINDIPPIQRIECGIYHSMCIDINNNLWVFGNNSYGQLGLGDKINRNKPVKHPILSNIIDISSGGNHTFVKTINNKIYAFGNNNSSQLGKNAKKEIHLTPIQVFQDNENIWCNNTWKRKTKI